jgi:hypothetical protein
MLAVSADSVEYQEVPPDPGCYEERYRLTGHAALGLAVGLGSVVLGVWWQSPGISAVKVILAVPVIFSALAVILALPNVVAAARRMTAFRADYVGITLGAVPDNLTFFGRPAVFIPWVEVEQIILEFAGPPGRAFPPVERISLRQRGTAAASRRITGWRLDAGRLAAVAGIVAPGVPVIDVRTGSNLDVGGDGQGRPRPNMDLARVQPPTS